MKKRIHPATAVLVVAIALVLVMMSYRKNLERAAPSVTPMVVQQPDGPPMDEPSLGISWVPEAGGDVIRVMKVLPGPPPSRLSLLGVRRGDVLAEVDGKPCDFNNLGKALDALTYHGKPFTLTVVRGGKSVKLEAKKLPEALKRMKFDD